jgi:hypothetical protein
MGVSGQRHAPAALLPPGKGPPVPIGQEAGWAPEPVWTQDRGKIHCSCRGSNPDRPVVQSTILPELTRLLIYLAYYKLLWDFRFSRRRVTAVWDRTPCNQVEVDQRFRSAYCLHHQGDYSPDEDGGSTHIWKVGTLRGDYTGLCPRSSHLIGLLI